MKMLMILAGLCLGALAMPAQQLTITVAPVKITGQKAIVSLAMTNHLAEPVTSARAVCFLLDDQGKMVGQSAQWVIGGGTSGRPALDEKGGTTFNFVITSPHPFTATNLTAKVSCLRLLLASGKPADVRQSVLVTSASLSPKPN